ncbi:MAG: 2-C-methyl-D-erythritol 4-phosphate cytidylyltransferase, partial [Bacteroidetes bacterium]
MKKYAIIVAGGAGARMQSEIPKQFLLLKNKPILMQTLSIFASIQNIELILVLPENQLVFWENLCKQYQFNIPYTLALGGKTRIESVKNGLNCIKNEESLVAIHDGVRPLIDIKTIENSFEKAEKNGNAITVIPLKDSIRQKINEHET